MFNWTTQKEIKKLKKLGLSPVEKEAMRSSLLSYMQFHPVRDASSVRLIKQRSIILEFISIRKVMPIALLIALLFSGSVSYAAEQTLPGDLLYPVKVSINEEVRELVAVRSEAKANWQERRAERRLEEAEKLALSGELKADVIARLEQNFERHAENVEQKIAKLEEAGEVEKAAKLSSNLEASLEAHDKVLSLMSSSTVAVAKASDARAMSLSASAESESPNLLKLGLLVKARALNAEKMREKIEDKLAEKPEAEAKIAVEGKIGAAENKIESTKKFIELKKDEIGAEGYAKAVAKIADAEKLVVEAKAEAASGDNNDAFAKAVEAMRLAQKAKVSIELHFELDEKLNLKSIINGDSDDSSDDSDGDADDADNDDEDEDEDSDDSDEDEDESEVRGRGKVEIDIGL